MAGVLCDGRRRRGGVDGLIFVALSRHAKAIMAHPLFRDRGTDRAEGLAHRAFVGFGGGSLAR